MWTPEFCSALAVVLMRLSAVAGERGNDEMALTMWDAVRVLRPACREVEAFPGLLAMRQGEIAKALPLLQNQPTALLPCQLCELLLNGADWAKILEQLPASEPSPQPHGGLAIGNSVAAVSTADNDRMKPS